MAVETSTVQVVMPAMGDSVAEGTVLEWRKQEGDQVEAEETVVEISTDKVDAEVPAPAAGTLVKIHAAEGDTVDMELPAPASGTITEILVDEGTTVTVGQVIARMTARGAPAAARATTPGPGASETTRPPAAPDGDAMANVSPIARRVAAQEGIDLSGITGSARGGRITKADVLAASGNGAAAATHPAGAQQLKGGAAALARYMEQSREIPTATSFRTITVTVLDQRRKQLKDAGRRVSFTHLIAYAIARTATEDQPVMAHHFEEMDGKPHRIDDGACNLGLAVDVEKKDGTRTLM